MSNPNAVQFTGDTSDEEDNSSSVSSNSNTAPQSLTGKFNFLLNSDSRDKSPARPSFMDYLKTDSKEADNEDSEDDETEDGLETSKKKKVGSSLRNFFKRRRPALNENVTPKEILGFEPVAETSSIEEELSSGGSAEDEPVTPQPPQPPNPNQPPTNPNNAPAQPPQPPQPPINTTPNFGPPPPAGPGGNVPNLPPPIPNLPPAANRANQQPTTIIERRGSGIGPLVAFLAANYLSKRRDKKIKRSVSKLDKQLENTQIQAEKDRKRANAAELKANSKDREQQQRINRIERDGVRPDAKQSVQTWAEAPSLETGPAKNDPVKLSEVIASSKLAHETAKQAPKNLDSQPKFEAPAPVPKIPESYDSKSVAPEDLRESVFERRHEVKDSSAPATAPVSTFSTAPRAHDSQPSLQGTQGSSNSSTAGTSTTSTKSHGDSQSDDLYKQSIQQGIVVGLALIILGAIAYLLLA